MKLKLKFDLCYFIIFQVIPNKKNTTYFFLFLLVYLFFFASLKVGRSDERRLHALCRLGKMAAMGQQQGNIANEVEAEDEAEVEDEDEGGTDDEEDEEEDEEYEGSAGEEAMLLTHTQNRQSAQQNNRLLVYAQVRRKQI